MNLEEPKLLIYEKKDFFFFSFKKYSQKEGRLVMTLLLDGLNYAQFIDLTHFVIFKMIKK